MSDLISQRLSDLGITIPQAAVPVANYVTYAQSGNQLFISGQLPLKDGKLLATGKVGQDVTIEDAKKAAEACAINVLAQAQAALGDLNKIKRVVKIVVFVASAPDFYDIPQAANGASDLFVNVLGEAGKHARSAVGAASLPLNATVEVEAILEI
ncbi:RidA family protein [Bartonella sp. HY406]|uniref:RidA family protein n=1 Tax=Bartonella sp. HY406 TaxID=2979331 RepID=UPI0021C64B88|nr:RidA family protein [Bartonella sp. HY406]UXN04458.1 RidA family protein [Bartonella sp. HY406]